MSTKSYKNKKKQFVDHRGLNLKKSYSSFWMDDRWDTASKFSGLRDGMAASSDIAKLVKLANYRKAVTNFVKIVTGKDIPVNWYGSDSHTNGESITLSTEIKDTTFDVTVGLALHESSHIILTDLSLMGKIYDCGKVAGKRAYNDAKEVPMPLSCVEESLIKLGMTPIDDIDNASATDRYEYSSRVTSYCELLRNLLNWIEDRRIDNFIFKTSPGYKAYYHKLYDYYWNDSDIHLGFASREYRDPKNINSWMFHIVNSINPSFNVNNLPRLNEIMDIIDLRNISRLTSTQQSLDVAIAVAEIIYEVMGEDGVFTVPVPGNNSKANGGFDSGDSDINEDGEGGDGEGESGDDGQDGTPSTEKELNKIEKILDAQKKFLNGELGKKKAGMAMQKKLESIAKQNIDLQTVGGDNGTMNKTCLTYDYTKGNPVEQAQSIYEQISEIKKANPGIYGSWSQRTSKKSTWEEEEAVRMQVSALEDEARDLLPGNFFPYANKFTYDGDMRNCRYEECIKKGLDMGGLLGKKLQLHNEERERVDNRLRNGKIDAKRLAHAGYGIENVFNQIHIDKYKKANLHISLDGSGSMSGTNWDNTITMALAIAKAAKYTQNISVQISIRGTLQQQRGELPVNLFVYDSRKNSLNHLVNIFSSFDPGSMTPEGLCFEALVRGNQIIPSSNELDSYFLNISDGQPSMHGYGGYSALAHTNTWIKKIKNLYNVKVLSFFMDYCGRDRSIDINDTEAQATFLNSSNGRAFKTMYGKDAAVVSPHSAIQIARELNKKFMTLA